MSVYFVKGKGYRYDFTLNGIRYTGTWFKTERRQTGRSPEKGGTEKPETGSDGGSNPNRHGLLGAGEHEA